MSLLIVQAGKLNTTLHLGSWVSVLSHDWESKKQGREQGPAIAAISFQQHSYADMGFFYSSIPAPVISLTGAKKVAAVSVVAFQSLNSNRGLISICISEFSSAKGSSGCN